MNINIYILSSYYKKIKFNLFGKTKKGQRRTIRLFGIKINYKKKIKKFKDDDKLQKRISEFNQTGVTTEKRKPQLIISVTSFSQRIRDVHFTLYSLLTQTLKPDAVVLWLGEEEFPDKENNLPQSVLALKRNGLTIKWCKDTGSYKKLIPSLKEYPDDIIVTADDDIYYRPNWLELLYNAYLKEPQYIHCHRAHRITFDKNENITEYSKWSKEVSKVEPSFCNFLTGGGGALFPPKSLYKDALDEELFLKLSPTADDLWFWAMAVLNNTKINVIKNNISKLFYTNAEREFGLNDEKTLAQKNIIGGGNDKQIKNILHHYPALKNSQ